MTTFNPALLRALNILLTEKSVTRAARCLNISQSTMSGILARLREQFSDPLLVRDGPGMQLTYRATQIAALAKQAALAVEHLSAPAEAPELKHVRRTFTIMASDYGLHLILLEALRRAALQAPLVRFVILPITSPTEGVFDGLADLSFTGDTVGAIEPLPAGLIMTRVVLRESYLCAVSRLFESDANITSEEYGRHRRATIIFDRSLLTLEDRVVRVKPSEPAQFVLPSFHAIGALVQHGDAIALLPARLGKLLQETYHLRLLEPAFVCAETEFRMLWHLRKDQDPLHRWFRKLVQETADALASPMASGKSRQGGGRHNEAVTQP